MQPLLEPGTKSGDSGIVTKAKNGQCNATFADSCEPSIIQIADILAYIPRHGEAWIITKIVTARERPARGMNTNNRRKTRRRKGEKKLQEKMWTTETADKPKTMKRAAYLTSFTMCHIRPTLSLNYAFRTLQDR